MDQDNPQAEWLQLGAAWFRKPVEFTIGVAAVHQLPTDQLPEIAFAGRSNVGKSSLINALTNQQGLARTSGTPGHTRQVNFFKMSENRGYVVDLPGYGYAKASKGLIKGWTQLIYDYLRGRVPLRRVFLLIDSRHGIKENDTEMMKELDELAVSYQIVLTKIDKIPRDEQARIRQRTKEQIAQHGAAYPEVIATSASKGYGMDELRAAAAEALSIR